MKRFFFILFILQLTFATAWDETKIDHEMYDFTFVGEDAQLYKDIQNALESDYSSYYYNGTDTRSRRSLFINSLVAIAKENNDKTVDTNINQLLFIYAIEEDDQEILNTALALMIDLHSRNDSFIPVGFLEYVKNGESAINRAVDYFRHRTGMRFARKYRVHPLDGTSGVNFQFLTPSRHYVPASVKESNHFDYTLAYQQTGLSGDMLLQQNTYFNLVDISIVKETAQDFEFEKLGSDEITLANVYASRNEVLRPWRKGLMNFTFDLKRNLNDYVIQHAGAESFMLQFVFNVTFWPLNSAKIEQHAICRQEFEFSSDLNRDLVTRNDLTSTMCEIDDGSYPQ